LSYLAPFLRYGDLLAIFPTPVSFVAHAPYVPFEFRVEVSLREQESCGYLNRQTESNIANRALCIASYADAL